MTLLQLGALTVALIYGGLVIWTVTLIYQSVVIIRRRRKLHKPNMKKFADHTNLSDNPLGDQLEDIRESISGPIKYAKGDSFKDSEVIIEEIPATEKDIAFVQANGLSGIKELDSKSKQNKENLYKASKCCGVMTEVPKQGAARCAKCNKFTSLL